MFIKEITEYKGDLIHSRFAYKYLRDRINPHGNIISFIGPMEVTTNLVDLEDALNQDYIYSDKAINFCFELDRTNLWGGVAFQRLFCSLVGNTLSKYIDNCNIEIDGDDIFVLKEFTQGGIVQNRGKSSVSIVTEKQGAILGHLGINIVAGKKAPAFAFSTNLSDEKAMKFIQECEEIFHDCVRSIYVATTKVI